MIQKREIVMLPTDKASQIYTIEDEEGLYFESRPLLGEGKYIQQNLYILSDEEIREGDWVYYDGKELGFPVGIYKVLDNVKNRTSNIKAGGVGIHHHISEEILENGMKKVHGAYLKIDYNISIGKNLMKIIATTNSELLIKRLTKKGEFEKGLFNDANSPYPVIEDAKNMGWFTSVTIPISASFIIYFIEQYNLGNVIKEVDVEYEEINDSSFAFGKMSGIFNPIKPKLDKEDCLIIHTKQETFTREELKASMLILTAFPKPMSIKSFEEWFNKNY